MPRFHNGANQGRPLLGLAHDICFTPFIYTLSAIAIIYTSSTTLRQIDLKKIIAYSSVAHMNLVTIGMFSRAAAVRSPILSYGHTRPKHVCRACDPSTYQQWGRKHSMSQQKLDSRRQQNIAVCFKNFSPLAPRDGSGGDGRQTATAAPAPRSLNRIFLLAFPIHS